MKDAYVNFLTHCYIDTEAEVKEIYASNHMWQLFECSFIHDMEAVTLPSSSTPALRNYVTGTLAHIITTFFLLCRQVLSPNICLQRNFLFKAT